MPKKLVSREELIKLMNDQLHKEPDYVDYRIGGIKKLDGLNPKQA